MESQMFSKLLQDLVTQLCNSQYYKWQSLIVTGSSR